MSLDLAGILFNEFDYNPGNALTDISRKTNKNDPWRFDGTRKIESTEILVFCQLHSGFMNSNADNLIIQCPGRYIPYLLDIVARVT